MRIACVHQGYELYGSDRCFVESVAAIRYAFPSADLEVVLPRSGPIVKLLEDKADRVTLEPLWVLRRASLLRLISLGAVELPFALARAARRLKECDLVYVNTCVIIDYMLAARFFSRKALLHIHEIPQGPIKPLLRGLVQWSKAEIIFNSRATRDAFAPAGLGSAHVIYNGVRAPKSPETTTFDGSRPLRVLLLGRVNRIKGQNVLLRAVASLPEDLQDRFELRLVGGAFENPKRERALAQLVAALGLSGQVSIEPFVEDPAALYRWANVVAVPSRLPESLGRVAIEAMAYGRPPIVSAIGGLTEVVDDGVTGWFVPPDNSQALAARLRDILESPDAWRSFGAAARSRFDSLFSETAAATAITCVVSAKLAASVTLTPADNQENTIEL